jgi:hypothetical protein
MHPLFIFAFFASKNRDDRSSNKYSRKFRGKFPRKCYVPQLGVFVGFARALWGRRRPGADRFDAMEASGLTARRQTLCSSFLKLPANFPGELDVETILPPRRALKARARDPWRKRRKWTG